MASEELQEHDGILVGDRIEFIDDVEDGMFSEGEQAVISKITRYTGTMNDRVAIYVLPEGAEDGEDALYEVSPYSFEVIA